MKITIPKSQNKACHTINYALKIVLIVLCLLTTQVKAQEYQAGAFRFTIPQQEGVKVSVYHERLKSGALLVTCQFTMTSSLKNEIII